ncbi:MAG: DUF3073 domain-containing protein [Actinomycetaceae bacterium]|nr:DUF3073 domain-containing protein [Arcanobacterium sp.]MDD7505483.1 DUF3073 domain-containing protein [Actinomycetaceae bacterium]MDY6143169.1 DUF3073 domain-containing protein [Arcanobacterium sp.]
MGRGRQKAKQRKVARNLKYFSPETDYAALERELTAHGGEAKGEGSHSSDDYDAYAEYAAKYAIPDDEDDPYAEYAEEYSATSADDDAER